LVEVAQPGGILTLDPCDLTFCLGDSEPSFSVTAGRGLLQMDGEVFGVVRQPIGKVCRYSTHGRFSLSEAGQGTSCANRGP
jgi:hypothetical protein